MDEKGDGGKNRCEVMLKHDECTRSVNWMRQELLRRGQLLKCFFFIEGKQTHT